MLKVAVWGETEPGACPVFLSCSETLEKDSRGFLSPKFDETELEKVLNWLVELESLTRWAKLPNATYALYCLDEGVEIDSEVVGMADNNSYWAPCLCWEFAK